MQLDVAAPGAVKPVDPFALGDRLHVLNDIDEAPVYVHHAKAEGSRYSYEELFRTVHKHLVDVAHMEEVFDAKFFGPRFGPETFTLVMARTVSTLMEALENYLTTCYDAPGLMLLVALVAAFRALMERKRTAGLTNYFNRVTMLVWPRLKHVLEQHIAAVRSAKDRVPQLFPRLDTSPQPVTKRYAELVCSILVLHRSLAALSMSDEHLPLTMCVLFVVAAFLRALHDFFLQRTSL
jgi:hypothetical protein